LNFLKFDNLSDYLGKSKKSKNHTRGDVMKIFKKLLADESGVTAVEYALLAAGIGGAITIGGGAFATSLEGLLSGLLP
jgi:Flp pilus assembly pilin Flp